MNERERDITMKIEHKELFDLLLKYERTYEDIFNFLTNKKVRDLYYKNPFTNQHWVSLIRVANEERYNLTSDNVLNELVRLYNLIIEIY